MRSRAGLLMAALAMTAAMPELPVLEVRKLREDEPLWPMKPDPDNRGRRAEKDAIALAKAEAKRQRKAAKRLGQKVGAGDTALETPNVERNRAARHHRAAPVDGSVGPLEEK